MSDSRTEEAILRRMESHRERRGRCRGTQVRRHPPVPWERGAETSRAGRSLKRYAGGVTLPGAVLLLAALFCLAVPAAGTGSQTMVLKYSDFGPPSMAWKTIGMDWWQWDSTGGPDPTSRCDIKVVVYRGVPLERVKRMYPVLKERSQDFRYLDYSKALEYLDKAIKDLHDEEAGVLKSLAQRLRNTRKKILIALGEPRDSGKKDPTTEHNMQK